eukprot:TRINITY_DN3754_c0_g1_i2.p4 TRINITY_DN3754_c0_g1~~TRINITY_DN3754_c0_g1_i2.p4  ORF type:complete len:144 (+),score=37.48 TRINITY_DN3754_c0_g1_i2:310-741(+)
MDGMCGLQWAVQNESLAASLTLINQGAELNIRTTRGCQAQILKFVTEPPHPGANLDEEEMEILGLLLFFSSRRVLARIFKTILEKYRLILQNSTERLGVLVYSHRYYLPAKNRSNFTPNFRTIFFFFSSDLFLSIEKGDVVDC